MTACYRWAATRDEITPHSAASTRRPPTMAEIQTHLAAFGLAEQKWPEEIRKSADFPRTPSGKIKKFEHWDTLRAENR